MGQKKSKSSAPMGGREIPQDVPQSEEKLGDEVKTSSHKERSQNISQEERRCKNEFAVKLPGIPPDSPLGAWESIILPTPPKRLEPPPTTEEQNSDYLQPPHSLTLNWNNQDPRDRDHVADLRDIIVQGIRESVPRGQNINKAFKGYQNKEEPPTEWLERLRKSFQLYSGLDPNNAMGQVMLKMQFVQGSWEDIRKKLEKIEDWQDKGLDELLREAQKIYWIENYSSKVKFLHEKLTKEGLVKRSNEDEEKLESLKEDLVNAPVLSLPDIRKPFYLFVNTENGTAYGVLTQVWAGQKKPVGYYSRLLDPLELEVTDLQNPAQFLYGEPKGDLIHDCLQMINLQTKIREDLEEEELEEGEKLYIDGSSRVVDGCQKSGYAVVDGVTFQIRESGPLDKTWSAQACELYALVRALEQLKGKVGTTFTDSKYAFGVAHTFGKIWEERGLINTHGKRLVHEALIRETLKALRKPERVAVVRVKGHQKGLKLTIRGNNLADEEAKQAALSVITDSRPESPNPLKSFSNQEKEKLRQVGAKEDNNKWKLTDGWEVLLKGLAQRVMARLHEQTHWGTQALVDQFESNLMLMAHGTEIPYQPYKWTTIRLDDMKVIKEVISAGASTFNTTVVT
ncbi:hypothetical protein BTVI_42829 [Pitangus sulphuratus]|nr:hypothetical protein BTVI_42829 [Pitangus sulphuratus]